MIKNAGLVRAMEDAFLREEGGVDHVSALKLFSGMWEEAVALGVLPMKDPLEGIEVDIRVAAILNSCSKSLFKR
ncbi:MAG: hypothetical protein A3J24_08055 [Deltaproteobacteria bacterium RIFCSPLOWO2_02_FULL_53_8]|nr:MAG: hypothetical protein A3J24_08055 [Deltaproteobacteria bacterium RIFCSPLOWO2_02_FULL_53_8]